MASTRKEIDKDLKYAKMTKELKVEQTFLGKKDPIRMAQWLNLLFYISIPLLVLHGSGAAFISHYFLLVIFTAKLNQKVEGVMVKELFQLHHAICVFIAFVRTTFGDKKF